MAKKTTKDKTQEVVANCNQFEKVVANCDRFELKTIEEHRPKLRVVNVFHVFPIFALSKTHQ